MGQQYLQRRRKARSVSRIVIQTLEQLVSALKRAFAEPFGKYAETSGRIESHITKAKPGSSFVVATKDIPQVHPNASHKTSEFRLQGNQLRAAMCLQVNGNIPQ